MQKTKQITKLGIITRPNTPNIKDVLLKIKEDFLSLGIELFLEANCAKKFGLNGHSLEWLVKHVDGMASLGGDGTLLSACRKLYGKSIPVFGINVGNLGFLTAISPNQVKDFAKDLYDGNYLIQEHMMLEASIDSKSFFAINEFLICQNSPIHGILEISAYIDKNIFNTYRADSLIIATPTGSTAYNISAGGSIVYPLCQNILLTPVAAHTLTQRPMVLDASFVLNFRVNSPATLLIDGQEHFPLSTSSILTIKQASQKANLIQPKNRCYFQVLKEKFQWGQTLLTQPPKIISENKND